jgi:phosphoglycerate kinase
MGIKSIRDIDIKGKRVFFRFDFNVPLDDSGKIKDDTRIRRTLPTIEYAVGQGAKCIFTSHLGRPKGERKPELTLKPIADRLTELLNKRVGFVGDCIGDDVKKAVNGLQNGDMILLENFRFYAGETKNDPEFARSLASLADVYVNDAFGTAHRAHASTVGVADLLPVKAAGFLMKEELDQLEKAFKNPAKPVVAIFGGAKVSDKLSVLQHIINRMDVVLIGGGMANTFLKAENVIVGASKIEEDLIGTAAEILKAEKTAEIVLPKDVVVADKIDASAVTKVVGINEIPADQMTLDIGPETIKEFKDRIDTAQTIVWNGPLGVFEIAPFSKGTVDTALAVANSKAFSLVGGGDTIRAVKQAGVSDKISYMSTGGGAFMEFMEGKTLPGVAALES